MNKLKLTFIIVCFLQLIVHPLKAQISGTVTVPGTYSSIAVAVADINIQPITGPLTVLISAGYSETAPVGGYVLTATGTLANPIIFQKSGAGTNPLMNAYAGGTATPSSALQDGVFRLIGSDYITIDGIDIKDPNVSNPSTMEFGYGLFKSSATNGCQNNTIKNCTVTLNRINNVAGAGPALEGSRGIDVVNAVNAAHTIAIVVTAASGANSNNKFYSNTIQNCNIGIALSGFAAASPFSLADTGNDAGGNSAATGNTIVNYGGGASANPATAVRTAAQYGVNVSYNIINNNNGAPGASNHANILRGVYLGTATSANATVNNNTITVKGAGTSATVAAIENASGATPASNTITINNNLISGCSYSTATSGNFYYILNNATAANVFINNNVLSSLTLNPAAGNGLVGFIYNNAVVGTALSILSNTIENTTNINTTGNIYGFYTSNATQNYTVQNNYMNNISRTGGLAGNFYGVYNNNNGATAGTALINNNIFSNLSQSSTSVFYGIFQSTSTSQNEIVSNNLFNTISAGSGTSYIIYHSYGNAGSAISSNTVSNIFSIGGITGIYYGNSSAISLNVNNNLVYGMSTTSSSNITGIWQFGGSFTYNFKNKIYDITGNGTASNAYGMYFVSGSNNYISNNIIGDIKAPSSSNPATQNCIAGLFFQGGANYYVNYNTVRIDAASGGTSFYTSACYAYTVPTVNLRNNIFINNSISNSGVATAYRRNGNNLATYSVSSDNNLFYAGGPGTSYVFWDNVTPRPTLTSYTTFVSPKDAASVTENTSFLSLTGSSPNFLHVDPLIATLAESNAVNIAGITDDFDNDIRQGNPGYIGTGTAPDIGADEFNMVISACNAVTASTISPLSQNKCAGQTASFSGTGTTSGSGVVYQWQVSATPSGPYSNVVGGIGMNSSTGYTTAALSTGTYYYVLLTTCTVSALSVISNEATLTVNPNPTITVNSGTICSGQSFTMVPSGANTYTFSSGSAVVSPTTNTSYSVTGTSAAGCVGSNTAIASITVSSIPALSVTATSNSVCIGNSSTLTVSGANTYSWNTSATTTTIAVSPTITTVYNVSGTLTATGCSAAINKTITVNLLPNVVAAGPSSVCAGSNGCFNSSGALTYFWSGPCGFTSNVPNPCTTINTGCGCTYTVTGVDFNNCSNTATVCVAINPSPTIAVNSGSVCSGSSFTITPSGANTYTFSSGSAIVSPTTTTSYSVTGTSAAGCISSSPAISNVTVNPNPVPILSSNSPVCLGSNINLFASTIAGASYQWNGPGGYISGIQNPIIASATSTNSGVYNASVTVSGCIGTASINVTVITPTTSATNTGPYCVGTTISLSCASATTYSWSGPGGFNSNLQNPTISNATLPMTGIYTVVVSIGSCTTMAATTVSISTLPIPNINFFSPVCVGQPINLIGSGGTTYTWTGPGSFSSNSSSVVIPSASTSDAGIYVLTVTGGICTASTSANIIVNTLPTITANTSNTIICGPPFQQTVTITASGASTYTWNTSATTTAIAVSPSVTTNYTVTGTDVNGCSNSTSFTQSVSACTGLDQLANSTLEINVYPNPFNNKITLIIDGEKQTVQIFNILGSIVFSSMIENEKTEIDLTQQPSGIYFIRIGSVTKKIIKE